MRIAVASEGLAVSPYFGHCASFTCYRIERGIIVECQNMPNPHQTPARIAAVLRELDVTAVITGIIERDAVEALQAADIEVVSNQAGSARDAAEAYLAHTLIGTDEWHNDDEVLGALESSQESRQENPPLTTAPRRLIRRGAVFA